MHHLRQKMGRCKAAARLLGCLSALGFFSITRTPLYHAGLCISAVLILKVGFQRGKYSTLQQLQRSAKAEFGLAKYFGLL
jgi:hypothetical protein